MFAWPLTSFTPKTSLSRNEAVARTLSRPLTGAPAGVVPSSASSSMLSMIACEGQMGNSVEMEIGYVPRPGRQRQKGNGRQQRPRRQALREP